MIAIYAGSFDPLTTGHLSVIRRAVSLFDHVRVLIGQNPNKTPLLSLDERLAHVRSAVAAMPTVSVDATDGLVVDYATSIGARILVRGIRNAEDAESETRLAQLNCGLAPGIETVLLAASPQLGDVSSSALKEKIRHGEDVSRYCLPGTDTLLATRMRQEEAK